MTQTTARQKNKETATKRYIGKGVLITLVGLQVKKVKELAAAPKLPYFLCLYAFYAAWRKLKYQQARLNCFLSNVVIIKKIFHSVVGQHWLAVRPNNHLENIVVRIPCQCYLYDGESNSK